MAITPRTILTSAAPATVAVVSLYVFTVLGTAAYHSAKSSDLNRADLSPDQTIASNASCDVVFDHFGNDQHNWSENAWIHYALCFEQQAQSSSVVEITQEALTHYPRSEVLFNIQGYHLIEQGLYGQAIDTLQRGLQNVQVQRTGTMANNLAWASLWDQRAIPLKDARSLYLRSLSLSPNTCETLHTGLFVEYAIAQKAHGLDRFEALKRFADLRQQYNGCLNRMNHADEHTALEIAGATVLFESIDSGNPDNVSALTRQSVAKLSDHFRGETIDEICRQAMPMADMHHQCVETVTSAAHTNRLMKQNHVERNQKAQRQIEVLNQNGQNIRVIRSPHSEPRPMGFECNHGIR
ncbi:hypothetical protein DL240_07230 [Lujinxingia litoralis]|uniref:Tetratricopeptide repeat protein n=1 Tax=Lujinxingia litoralis TaxID=2211119 RepID=A0A328C9W7_9DELT|nr:hypothetical protein [Lujinxingia litoralis]RAL23932.1 hypothetical protein DL240_07230 [Lujinxingia litoralis]